MTAPSERIHLTDFTTSELSELFERASAADHAVVALVGTGSVEPHGPHLPLDTDTVISAAAAAAAVPKLRNEGVVALVGPPVAYGVTDFAEGFAGAVSLPPGPLTSFLNAVVRGYLHAGFAHVCLINNHLEPAQDAAVRASIVDLPKGTASVACPLTRRWGRTLTAEFKRGACHAGQYETSIVVASAPERVRPHEALAEVEISLSDGIREGKNTFAQMGMTNAYAGAPASASAHEGRDTIEKLANMVTTEVLDALRGAPSAALR